MSATEVSSCNIGKHNGTNISVYPGSLVSTEVSSYNIGTHIGTNISVYLYSLVNHGGVVVAPDFPICGDKTGQHFDEHLQALGVLDEQADRAADRYELRELLP